MDHRLIRSNARYLLKGKLLSLWMPFIVVELITLPFALLIYYITENGSTLELILSTITSLLLMPLTVGVYEYYLDVVRGKDASLKSLFGYFSRFGTILISMILVALLAGLGFMALIIPYIIIILMYSQIFYVIVDKPDYGPFKCLKESRELMKGYKFDYVIFNLKFVGWILLTILTCGLAGIYVIPYMTLAQTKYYDNLVELKKN